MITMEKAPHTKLCNRLTYILRYGAIREGLAVYSGGYVLLDELMLLHIMRKNTKDEILKELKESTSVYGAKRFQLKETENGSLMVRVMLGRVMEPGDFHENSSVLRLVNISMNKICSNIKDYDLEDFPDEYLLRRMFRRLKHERKLTNAVLKSIISSAVRAYSFHGVYITTNTLKLVCQRCKNLKSINLAECGYVVNNDVARMLAKNLKHLEDINVSHCDSLNDTFLKDLLKFKSPIKTLNISYCTGVTIEGLKTFVAQCVTLKTLIAVGLGFMDEASSEELKAIALSMQQMHSDPKECSIDEQMLNICYRNYDKERRYAHSESDEDEIVDIYAQF